MQNIQRKFDTLQKEKLGKYIYALRDPRDGKIFYVGQGTNDRIFEHFNEANNCIENSMKFEVLSSKIIRILDIWKSNEDVEWIILSYNLPIEDKIADLIEAAIFDSLSESQNGDTLNEISPPHSSRLLPDDLDAMAAEYVNPTSALKYVFVFPIQNVLKGEINPYDATRTTWSIALKYRNLKNSYAVGLKNSISKGSYEIENWNDVPNSGKQEFISPQHPNANIYNHLYNKNWNNILAKAKGYWQRGNYLIIEFNGVGKFRVIRGAKDTNTWHNCI